MSEIPNTPLVESDALVERRRKPRVICSYPALVRGQAPTGMQYEARAVLTNLSATGMYLLTHRQARLREQVQVTVRLSTAPLDKTQAPSIAASGSVVRVEPRSDGSYGVAVVLHSYSFI